RPRPDARAYTALLKVAYQAAKKADPSCVVVLGGLQMNGLLANPWSEVKVPNFLEDLYQAGARPYFDICNTHPYVLPAEGAARMMEMTQDTLALMARHGDAAKPLWITEAGCGAATVEDERAQARLLEETFELAGREPRIQRVFWFLLRDLEKDVLGPESTMGLFKTNGGAKPALEAFKRGQPSGKPTAR
ncbi:MAG: glycosyl hydrolase, partial [Chthoniobacteraceae bacterium]